MAVIRDRYELVVDTNNAVRGLGNVATAVKGFVGVLAVDQVIDFGKAIVNASNEMTQVRNRLSLVTDSAAELDSTMARLTSTAAANRASFSETANLYSTLSVATEALGYSQEQVLAITTKFQQALAVSGADANTAAGAIRQFGQAMGSGTVRGDEFNSIVEALGPALAIMARESGYTVGQLRDMSQAGDLTAEAFSEMLMNSTALNSAFQNMTITTDQLEQQFSDSFTYALSKMDELIGVSNSYRGVLGEITRELDQFSGREGAIANIADEELFRMASEGAMSFDAALAEVNNRLMEAPVGLWHIWTNSIPEDVQNLMDMRDTIQQMKEDAEAAANDAANAGVGLGENVADPVNEAATELDLATSKLTAVLDDFADDATSRIARQRNELELAALSGVDRALTQIRHEEERRLQVMVAQVEASEADTAEKERQIARLREITRQTIASRQEIERQTEATTIAMREQQEALRREQNETNESASRAQQTYVDGWAEAFNSYTNNAENAVNRTTGIFDTGTQSMLNSLDQFVQTGKFSLDGFVNDIQTKLRGNLVNGIGNALSGLTSQISGGNPISSSGGGGNFVGDLFNNVIGGIFGRRQLGGSVMAGSAYMVGENGREIFVPNTSGSILPSGDMGNTNINFTVNAVDTVGFDDYLNRRRGDIVDLVRQAMQENRGRF